jgi:YVTN family beta-propeller protein
MKLRSLLTTLIAFTCLCASFAQNSGYRVIKTYKILSPGGWDYIAAHNGRLYVSHGTQVNILNEQNGDSVSVIPNTTGVHGIAFIEPEGKGYTSNGRINNITVFDLKTNRVLKQIPVGQNPDAIMYEPFSKKIITCNGRSQDLSMVDPVTEKVVATIPVGGKPETAVSDGEGKLYVNLEDKNRIAVVNLRTGKVESSWPLSAEGPTGLAIDKKTKRLFAGCDKFLVVMDATNGEVMKKLPIGDGCDGVAFDNNLKYIFASCGEGKLSIIQELSGNNFKVIDNVQTKRSARTIAIDEYTHEVFLPAADLQPAKKGERPQIVPGTFQVLVMQKK